MLPSGTGPNAIAWATGHIALPRMLKAGLLLDLAGIPLDGRDCLDDRRPARLGAH